MNAKQTIMVAGAVLGMAQAGWAYPTLQLDIVGGTYVQETTYAVNQQFNLWALYNGPMAYNTTDSATATTTVRFTSGSGKNKVTTTITTITEATLNIIATYQHDAYISAALTPNPGADVFANNALLFSINGKDKLFSDFTEGTPSLLQPHGIFPTYYTEIPFSFDPNSTVQAYNVQDVTVHNGPTTDPDGTFLSQKFSVIINENVPNPADYSIHFDLYDTLTQTIHEILSGKVTVTVTLGKGSKEVLISTATDTLTDVEKEMLTYYFSDRAPYSHDAQSLTIGSPIPDGSTTITLLGLAMFGLGAFQRRVKK